MKTVLIYSDQYSGLERILDVLELNGFNSIPCITENDTLKCITLTNFDALILDNQVNKNSQKIIRENLKLLYPQIPVIECYSPFENLAEEIKNKLNI